MGEVVTIGQLYIDGKARCGAQTRSELCIREEQGANTSYGCRFQLLSWPPVFDRMLELRDRSSRVNRGIADIRRNRTTVLLVE
jgi:hypothetical protein